MKLHLTLHGTPTEHPPLIMAHGLYGSARNLGGLARRLSDERQVIAVDMRNHGDSPWSDDHSYSAMAADLADIIAEHGGRADVFGHSMGGKAAMMLALNHPESVRRLIAADIAPVAYTHSLTGFIDAMESMDRSGLKLRSEADKRLSRDIADPGVRAFLLQSLDLSQEPAQWKFNLPVLRAYMGQLTGWPAPHGGFGGPVLFLNGTRSDYIEPSHHGAIFSLFSDARIEAIEAGHWLHAERPAEVEAAIRAHLA